MAILVEGSKPFSAGDGINIDSNKVISVLLREENNLIMVNEDRELYTDLQFAPNISSNSEFPVGVTVGKVLEADGWEQSGIILNWKTTSGDYARWIYGADGKIYFDGGTGERNQVYYSDEVDDLFTQLRSELATVAFTGDYNDLRNRPQIPVVNDGELTITRNGTTLGTFTANQSTDGTIDIEVPTTVAELTDSADYAKFTDLATVATTGDYDDLLDKPTIGDATITIKKNNTTVDSFTANATSDKSINITVPTTVAELTDSGDYVTDSELSTALADYTPTANLAAVALSNDYDDLDDKPTIGDATLTIQKNGTTVNSIKMNATTDVTANIVVPTDTSDLTNNAGFVTNQVNDTAYGSSWDGDTTNAPSKNAVYDKIQTVVGDINTINGKIPSAASSSNQLTDKNYVDSSINSVSAYYITKNAAGDQFATYAELSAATTFYSGGVVRVPTRNDYTIVLDDETHSDEVTRYIYNNGWEYQYTINESPMTQAQLDALNSGITSSKVTTYDGYATGKQDNLVSGTNIKTINNTSVLGSGNIDTNQVSDTAYASSWNGVTGVAPSKNAVYDKISAMDTTIAGKADSSSLATVATSGSYADLSNKPTIPTVSDAAYSSSWDGETTSAPSKNAVYDKISAMDTTISGKADSSSLATVATSGSYNDLSNKPTIPAAQVNSDWDASSGVAQILNKPNLATVATSGSYNDLSNKPTIPAAQVQTDWNATTGMGVLLNKPTLATVATSGSYNDLSNKPTIPTVNNGTLTIKQNGTSAGTFTANQSGNSTIELTDTTYESKAAASGGTDLSLVTTGEKATWNAKQSALSTQTAYTSKGTSTKVPTITTNTLGQVTAISETSIAFPVTSVNGSTGAVTGLQPEHKTLSLTLTTAGWSNNTQTVTATGVTASNTVIVSPAPASFTDYGNAQIYCSAQASNSLTFTCGTVPSSAITVNVVILN